ncbi:MAG: putative toxin-antitoxin system toxin component, PIN family [Cardiobacteriaceae bacterium]|nr:putative toxin-antitoxin system toxin component, PIN family [Cardiobacteriaceae bacterium]
MIYAVIDTNVLVSALLSRKNDAATVQVLEKVLSAEIIPLLNKTILTEYQEVLLRPKFGFSNHSVEVLISFFQYNGIFIKTKATDVVLIDKDDLPFYEIFTNTDNKNAYLITGNIKHFPNHPRILTARNFLDTVNL